MAPYLRNFETLFQHIFTFQKVQVSRNMSRKVETFLSSSSTLGEGLEIMARPVDEVVGDKFALDSEEQQLQARLQARLITRVKCKMHSYSIQDFARYAFGGNP